MPLIKTIISLLLFNSYIHANQPTKAIIRNFLENPPSERISLELMELRALLSSKESKASRDDYYRKLGEYLGQMVIEHDQAAALSFSLASSPVRAPIDPELALALKLYLKDRKENILYTIGLIWAKGAIPKHNTSVTAPEVVKPEAAQNEQKPTAKPLSPHKKAAHLGVNLAVLTGMVTSLFLIAPPPDSMKSMGLRIASLGVGFGAMALAERLARLYLGPDRSFRSDVVVAKDEKNELSSNEVPAPEETEPGILAWEGYAKVLGIKESPNTEGEALEAFEDLEQRFLLPRHPRLNRCEKNLLS